MLRPVLAAAVLAAEVVHDYFPKLVELHNYSSANGTTQKMYNWNTLNQKVFKRLGFTLAKTDFEPICNCQVGVPAICAPERNKLSRLVPR